MRWGKLLTRGDASTAQDIVHDLCLYLALTKPDFSEVTNLDGYLYTSLRHVYLSWIAKSSRDALRFVSIGDFDSIQFAVASTQANESVDVQNDLRAICCYAVWRKDSSKSFSYFILHFFHGYFPREIAEIACLPLSAIYNKLKTSRAELRHDLAAPESPLAALTHRRGVTGYVVSGVIRRAARATVSTKRSGSSRFGGAGSDL
jgi:DNA-directed RNA polymerase specialized sigma24 family protein